MSSLMQNQEFHQGLQHQGPNSRPRPREFPLNCLRFHEELGEGAFGKVFKGEFLGANGSSLVAIKTLKPGRGIGILDQSSIVKAQRLLITGPVSKWWASNGCHEGFFWGIFLGLNF